MIAPTLPLDKSKFSLDTSGVAGIFGGDEAVSAMATIHIYENRRWLGWYNPPGSYQIAKRYGILARSRFLDGFFPGVHTDPITFFELDGLKGPKFRATQSGTIIEETSHVSALFMNECAAREGKVVEGRKTQAIGVTIAGLTHPNSAKGSPPGDGILGSDREAVLLKSAEGAAINSVTHGRFTLSGSYVTNEERISRQDSHTSGGFNLDLIDKAEVRRHNHSGSTKSAQQILSEPSYVQTGPDASSTFGTYNDVRRNQVNQSNVQPITNIVSICFSIPSSSVAMQVQKELQLGTKPGDVTPAGVLAEMREMEKRVDHKLADLRREVEAARALDAKD